MNFKDIINDLEVAKKNHEEGYFNCIPFQGMERLEKLIPGIEQDTYYLLTAGSGVGKSKLARSLFVHNPIQYVEANPDADVRVTIKYFSLEESKKSIILSEVSKYLFSTYGKIVSVKQLQSRGRHNTIDSETLEQVKAAERYITKFLSRVEIIDWIKNPTGIYKYMRNYAMTIGTYYKEDDTPFTPAEVEAVRTAEDSETFKKIAYYKKYDPKHFVIVLVDHISLLQAEYGLTLRETMEKYSSKYCIRMRDMFGFIPVNVQQQASDKEVMETNYRGQTNEEKLEPSLSGLGDCKTTQRDANVILGLFNPNRYNIEKHSGYPIRDIFKDKYRSLSILKDRNGVADKKVPLFFNGAVDYFRELPKLEDSQNMQQVYNYIQQLNQQQ